jgi:hypothetical protein
MAGVISNSVVGVCICEFDDTSLFANYKTSDMIWQDFMSE